MKLSWQADHPTAVRIFSKASDAGLHVKKCLAWMYIRSDPGYPCWLLPDSLF